jgi:hypothetical protein
MAIAWGAIAALFGYNALLYGNVANALAIVWFALGGAVLGLVATGLQHVFRKRRDTGPLVLSGALTGAVALAVLAPVSMSGGPAVKVLFAFLGFLLGAVLGFGASVFSLAIAERGLKHVLWALIQSQSQR